MFSLSARLGLKRPLDSHGFSRSEHFDNLSLIDQHPGLFICTSDSRPTWGTPHAGMRIWELDTNLEWRWTGSQFVRVTPLGMLEDPVERTSDFVTASTSPDVAMSLTVTVPPTNAGSTLRRIEVMASWFAIENGTDSTLGVAEVALIRSPSTVLKVMRTRGRVLSGAEELDHPIGGTIVAWDNPAAGSATYYLAINSVPSVGGSTTLKASATTPAHLAVKEVGL